MLPSLKEVANSCTLQIMNDKISYEWLNDSIDTYKVKAGSCPLSQLICQTFVQNCY